MSQSSTKYCKMAWYSFNVIFAPLTLGMQVIFLCNIYSNCTFWLDEGPFLSTTYQITSSITLIPRPGSVVVERSSGMREVGGSIPCRGIRVIEDVI